MLLKEAIQEIMTQNQQGLMHVDEASNKVLTLLTKDNISPFQSAIRSEEGMCYFDAWIEEDTMILADCEISKDTYEMFKAAGVTEV